MGSLTLFNAPLQGRTASQKEHCAQVTDGNKWRACIRINQLANDKSPIISGVHQQPIVS
jgi:hypothetical protein